MSDPRRIAGLLGPTLIALSVSEALTAHIWADVPVTQVYLAGTLWFVAGLAILRSHHQWSRGWPVLITPMGWFALLGGLFRMCAPESAQRSVPPPAALLSMQALLLVIGVVLTIKAYNRADT